MNALTTFRAIHIDNNEWVFGYYVNNNNFFVKHVIYSDMNLWTEIIPTSLGVFTGKYDINKKPIFASFEIDGKMTKGGDVCYHKRLKDKCNIFYEKEMFKFVWSAINEPYYINRTLGHELEIIANQFDNPELLEATT